MARPLNIERKQEIEYNARALFRKQGYRKTSYSAIAEACGLEKSNVQIHFAKKEFLVESFLQDLLDASAHYVEDNGLKSENDFTNFFTVGQIYHAVLLSEEGLRLFTKDILSDRNCLECMVNENLKWAAEYVPSLTEDDLQNIAFVMGGSYELLYRELAAGTIPSPVELQTRIMKSFLLLQGLPQEAIHEILPDTKVDLSTSSKQILEELF